ncbi:putative cathepsin B6 cysteine protease [Monocercomonoides exilis]|uniref:putative cathepsin B6 cysteine protease n=1 Tax=Monocercomonoides exilis TaxID=2049356 RepID=UPI003559B92B|nr:putative cathepsin B6 cysteine protease [Monocercomonoides exilis]|eukprot:MONOS_7194.1-p1 / transcript=MONOS_7194.1 / gene=MONOS_7194 / organism=Monocercomonoides_exilis_PA203 / gene_product=cathepsin B6 cysteine protease / transcript_product=cathepsin B6 cysteine protease / location=Mono_scaffold00240:53586-54368(-) / protein_length=242 / sequence_SO=supercontig / SO=protein_coding / is_pseudo=false
MIRFINFVIFFLISKKFSDPIPETFDARDHWPKINRTVRSISNCGQTCALIQASVVEDRMVVSGCSQGTLSIQDMVSCNRIDDKCNKCNWENQFLHIRQSGITTEECLPWVSGDGRVPFCRKVCQNKSPIKRWKVDSITKFTAANVQEEIMRNGPVSTTFIEYKDLSEYKSGVYTHKTGDEVGKVAAKVLGWGVEGEKKYWLLQTAWGESFGEKGLLKMLRGSNSCGCEENFVAPVKLCIEG